MSINLAPLLLKFDILNRNERLAFVFGSDFEVETPLGFRVRTTRSHWGKIVTHKHPVMAGHDDLVEEVLVNPDEIRVSRGDPSVFLFYRSQGARRWVCAVSKQLMLKQGFLITAYITEAIKEGDKIWPK
jgi:hypothetical protein